MDNKCWLTYEIKRHDEICNFFSWFTTSNELIDFVERMKIRNKSFQVIDAVEINDCKEIKLN